MPALDQRLGDRIRESVSIAHAAETARLSPKSSNVYRAFSLTRVELLYELAFLRVFLAWESYLEEVFVRCLCGYRTRHGIVAPRSGTHSRTLQGAQGVILGGRTYVLWHDPAIVVRRARTHLIHSPLESIVSSNIAFLALMAVIRHRIAHEQDDARRKFDVAAMHLTGRRYPGARPGRLLRDWHPRQMPRARWIDVLGGQISGLGGQIQ